MFDSIANFFQNLNWIHLVEFLFFATLFFIIFDVLRKNNATPIIFILIALVVVFGIICYFSDLNNIALLIFICAVALAVVVLFSTEIKRIIWNTRIKSADQAHHDSGTPQDKARDCINEIIRALQNMSKNNVGAIIILSNSNIPKGILDSGVALDADISSALIESVFFPKTPLHDGAMIINSTKIQGAGCFLPLAQETNIPKDLGTRHRAGIGITETINVTSIIVSEETGVISIAHSGKLKRYADTKMLRETLESFYWQELMN